MRIGHIIQSSSLATGGPVTAMFAMCNALLQVGSVCNIACRNRNEEIESDLDPRITISTMDIGRIPFTNRNEMIKLIHFIQDVDILHLHGLWDSLPGAAAGLAERFRKPYVVSLHGMLLNRSMANHSFRKKIYLFINGKKIMRHASALHFTTQLELSQSQPFLPNGTERVVIPLTIDNRLFKKLPDEKQWRNYFPQLPTSWPRLVFLSRIHPVKNLPSLINAMPWLVKEFPGLHLVVAGNGEKEYIRHIHQSINNAGISQAIYFVGSVSGEAKVALLRSATILTIPSFHENFGMSIAEGLMCEVPALITPDIGIGTEIIACGAGIPCREDHESISAAIAGALHNPEKLRIAGDNGRNWALKTLAPGTIATSILNLYIKISMKR
ncbi:MAG: glycosyltransferase [Planctomycetia bacterium]|nr:glycosyltransferase [Planctomycetia bacterium]